MHKIEVTQEQMLTIKNALEFYARVGIGQFDRIVEHPTFNEHLSKILSDQTPIKVGDKTVRGVVVEMDKKGKWVKTEGSWGKGNEIKEWTDVEKIRKSVDWGNKHKIEEKAQHFLTEAKKLLMQSDVSTHHSWGINNPNVDERCRVAFDIQKAISHEYWKQYADENDWSVDSRLSQLTTEAHLIKVELDSNILNK